MPDLEKTRARALELFDKRFNCGQSVMKAMTESLAMLSAQSTELIKASTVLGAGMSKQGHDCGALQAGALVLGFTYGTIDPDQPRQPTYDKVQQLYQKFQQRFGCYLCKDLSGYDLSTEEGKQRFNANTVHEETCPKYVAEVIKILFELMGYSKNRK